MNDSIRSKTINAAKWSSITELSAKIISPITNMILARMLAPEAFGILASVMMVISFAEVFVESGFQKFLIQHEFESRETEDQYISAAFWTNLCFSFLLWAAIIVFQKPIARAAGSENLGHVIAAAGVMIPMYAVIGIQNCVLKKRLDFKRLFFVRIPAALVPLFVTLPMAFSGFDYWALVTGNICGAAVRSILLAAAGGCKPKRRFRAAPLLHMLKYGALTTLDGLALWAANWIDALLIARHMTEYQLGLYKNSTGIITTLFATVASALTPVMYASLSRLQNDEKAFSGLFMGMQKLLCTLLLPLGAGVFLYRQLATEIILGGLWSGAAPIVGITAITLAFRTIFVSFNSEAYRAKGKFCIPLVLQFVDLMILVPACMTASRISFETLVYTRALVRLDLIVPGFILLYAICKISALETLKNLLPSFISTAVMYVFALGMKRLGNSMLWSFISIFFCMLVYFTVLFLFKKERDSVWGLVKRKIKMGGQNGL